CGGMDWKETVGMTVGAACRDPDGTEPERDSAYRIADVDRLHELVADTIDPADQRLVAAADEPHRSRVAGHVAARARLAVGEGDRGGDRLRRGIDADDQPVAGILRIGEPDGARSCGHPLWPAAEAGL